MFRKKLNISVTKYIIDKIVRLSYELLSDSLNSITRVSNMVGYQDSLYFSRIFKKYSGSSPSGYIAFLKDSNQYIDD